MSDIMLRKKATKVGRSWYTVVGVYTENLQKFCDHVSAVSAKQAEKIVRNNPSIDDDLLVVAVFKGKLMAVDQGDKADEHYARFFPSLGLCWMSERLAN